MEVLLERSTEVGRLMAEVVVVVEGEAVVDTCECARFRLALRSYCSSGFHLGNFF